MGAAASIDEQTMLRVDKAFKRIDNNFSGDIDVEEISEFINTSHLNDKSAAKLGKQWFDIFNTDGDNKITLEEFHKFFTNLLAEHGREQTSELLSWFEQLGDAFQAKKDPVPTVEPAPDSISDVSPKSVTENEISPGPIEAPEAISEPEPEPAQEATSEPEPEAAPEATTSEPEPEPESAPEPDPAATE